MRVAIGLLAGACAMTPGLAAAQGFPIRPGQELTLTIDDAGKARVRELRSDVPINAFESWAAANLIANDQASETTGAVDGAKAPATAPPEKGMVRIRFAVTAGGKRSVLVIDNGYDRALRYRATMIAGGRSVPTSVCIVLPQKAGVELWPHPIEALQLRELTLIPFGPTDNTVCE